MKSGKQEQQCNPLRSSFASDISEGGVERLHLSCETGTQHWHVCCYLPP